MSSRSTHLVAKKLCGEDLREIEEALCELERSPEVLRGPDQEELLSALFVLFLIDVIDHPELGGIVGRAERLVASIGTEAVPMVLTRFADTDLKSQFHLARTLVHIGMPGVPQVIEYHNGCPNQMGRSFALYAMSKIRDPEIRTIIPLVLKGMTSNLEELRDTSTRSLGKIVEVVPPSQVSEDVKRSMFDALLERAIDPVPGVRAKALRTLGKLASFGFLDKEQKAAARQWMDKALGKQGGAEPDPAFIVRREAEIALPRLG